MLVMNGLTPKLKALVLRSYLNLPEKADKFYISGYGGRCFEVAVVKCADVFTKEDKTSLTVHRVDHSLYPTWSHFLGSIDI